METVAAELQRGWSDQDTAGKHEVRRQIGPPCADGESARTPSQLRSIAKSQNCNAWPVTGTPHWRFSGPLRCHVRESIRCMATQKAAL